MINRILIRIKVVQMLYSYLLTRSEFRIESAPEKKTRDNVYAYRLYIDLLLLILKLSGQRIVASDRPSSLKDASGKNPLSNSAIAKSLASLSELKEHAARNPDYLEEFTDILPELHKAVIGSAAFNDYSKKRKHEIADDVSLWLIVIESIIAKDDSFIAACRRDNDFTMVGFQRGVSMSLNTLREYSDTRSTLVNARKSLDASLEQAYQLYHALLWLPVELTRMQADNLEAAKDKYLPTAEDLNPNMRFVENRCVEAISSSEKMAKYFKSNPFSWENDYFLLKTLLDEIVKSDLYAEYMQKTSTDFESDCEFWRSVMKNIVLPSDTLAEALESRSIYWNDDLAVMGTFVLKTMRRMSESANGFNPLPMFKDGEDEKFGPELFGYSINHFKEYRELIDSFINENQWDPERLAFMDIVIMTAAIAEILNFPSIPIPVTLNEYIEIANYYSTARSGQFINGILFSVINYLRAEGKLMKTFDSKNSGSDK